MVKKLFNRPASFSLGLVIFAPLAAWGYLWWHSQQADINFLPRESPAEWIIFPAKLSLGTHDVAELTTTFRRTVQLEKLPGRASVAVAGCRRYSVAINGVEVEATTWTNRHWKRPEIFDITSRLRTGDNQIMVTVSHSNGPPAMWLSLRTDDFTLNSDASWEAAYAGDPYYLDEGWRPVQLASAPRADADIPELGREQPWPCLRERWPTLLGFALLSVPFVWWLERRRPSLAKTPKDEGLGDTRWVILGLAAVWLALFVNNFGQLSNRTGYDARDHLAYVQFILDHKTLPVASDGWEMFQPPLYYLVGAILLKVAGLTTNSFAGVTALRVLGWAVGVAHFLIVWCSLRLLFPDQKTQQRWGLVLAGLSPVLIFMSQSITNEAAAAALMSASVYVCLRILSEPKPSLKLHAVLGLCVGAALLTKATALVLLPPVFGALLWRQFERREVSWVRWAGQAGLALAVCGLVCGWHYGRTWMLYGSPLIGGWDSRTGVAWWQDNGYHTSAFFLHFGRALTTPWFSGITSFVDGIYTTFWGDSLYGGVAGVSYRPAWNYDLMALGYALALLPTAIIVAGALLAVGRFGRQPSAEWFLILGLAFLLALALVSLSLNVPFFCSVKASYMMGALVPVCAFGAWGLEFLGRRSRILHLTLCVGMCVWGANAYASYWVRHDSVLGLLGHGQVLIEQQRYDAAIDLLRKVLPADPNNTRALNTLGFALFSSGRYAEAIDMYKQVVQNDPKNTECWNNLGIALAVQGQFDEAAINLQKAIHLDPDNFNAYYNLGNVLASQGKFAEAVPRYVEFLKHEPKHAPAECNLGGALAELGRRDEAITHFKQALRLDPNYEVAKQQLRGLGVDVK